MGSSYKIRRARPSELERVYELDKQMLDGSRCDYKYKSTVWWVALCGPRIVGYASGYVWDREGERAFVMTRCGVVPEHRGHGLQNRFIRVRVAYARRLDLPVVWTYTHANVIKSSNNLIAEGFRLWRPRHWAGERVRGTAWLHWEKRL